MSATEAHAYAGKVMAAITDRFPHLGPTSDVDRDVIWRAIQRHHERPVGDLEIILDGYPGNWRLKSTADQTGRVRLADYRMHMIGKPEDPAVTAVNEALEAL